MTRIKLSKIDTRAPGKVNKEHCKKELQKLKFRLEELQNLLFAESKHALLIISEAAVKLGDLAAELCPEIDWRDVRGLGNRLRHEYDSIDIARLWRIVERDLPVMKTKVAATLDVLRGKEAEEA